ncbi:MAG: glycosyltransferase family 2 protein [Candidatus Edwardsbacteria bacterium]|jgi:glycosyltransferase involved in cell wall biosynthesis|nr:glycosyltransferase family 2 protein [Candidatus Edwardsbacteria bacterium]
MRGISAIVIARDAARSIGACVGSLSCADEVIVVDSGSADGTAEAARQAGARVVVEQWRGFGAQRQRSLSLAAHGWVLFLDADERLTDGLRAAIAALPDDAPAADGYYLRRRNHFLGRPMRNTRWANDWQLRLFRKDAAAIAPVAVHEGVTVRGRTARLDAGVIDHDTVPSLAAHLEKLNRYTTLEARQRYDAGQRFSTAKLLVSPTIEFWKLLLVLGAWRDGLRGLAIAALSALYKLVTIGKLLELGRG